MKLHVPSLRDVLLLVPRMIGATFSAAVDVFYLTAQNRWPDDRRDDADRSEPIVSRIGWTGCVGDRLQHRVRVTNASRQTQEFRIGVTKFRGTDVSVDIDVTGKSLRPGKSLDALLSLTIPASLAGGCYRCSVIVTGARAERLVIDLAVKPRQAGVSVVEQGEVSRSAPLYDS